MNLGLVWSLGLFMSRVFDCVSESIHLLMLGIWTIASSI